MCIRDRNYREPFFLVEPTLTLTGIPNGLEIRVRKGRHTLVYENSVSNNSFSYTYNQVGSKVRVTVGGIADDGTAYERLSFDLVLAGSDQTIPLDFSLNPSYQ